MLKEGFPFLSTGVYVLCLLWGKENQQHPIRSPYEVNTEGASSSPASKQGKHLARGRSSVTQVGSSVHGGAQRGSLGFILGPVSDETLLAGPQPGAAVFLVFSCDLCLLYILTSSFLMYTL